MTPKWLPSCWYMIIMYNSSVFFYLEIEIFERYPPISTNVYVNQPTFWHILALNNQNCNKCWAHKAKDELSWWNIDGLVGWFAVGLVDAQLFGGVEHIAFAAGGIDEAEGRADPVPSRAAHRRPATSGRNGSHDQRHAHAAPRAGRGTFQSSCWYISVITRAIFFFTFFWPNNFSRPKKTEFWLILI